MKRIFTLLLCAVPATAGAHAGPPFPVVADRDVGAYRLSIWTDPDTTDDGTSGGQFWVTLTTRADGTPVPAATRVRVLVSGPDGEAVGEVFAAPVRNDPGNQFGALVLDREARYDVTVTVDGPLGHVDVTTAVDATYDLRPAPLMLVWYAMPFILVGGLWARLLWRRRGARRDSLKGV